MRLSFYLVISSFLPFSDFNFYTEIFDPFAGWDPAIAIMKSWELQISTQTLHMNDLINSQAHTVKGLVNYHWQIEGERETLISVMCVLMNTGYIVSTRLQWIIPTQWSHIKLCKTKKLCYYYIILLQKTKKGWEVP